jgi:SAM-dependent methyltransferase
VTAAARWRRLVRGRLEEIERLSPDPGPLTDAFWDRRAERCAGRANPRETEDDPLLRRLRRVATPSSTVIDVGAGTGRFALPLAAHVEHVTAVDPSDAMLAILRRDADERGVTNLTTVDERWEEAGDAVADVVFSAFVLTLVPDAAAFVSKLGAAARDHVFLYLGSYAEDGVLDPLWRHFHGRPRAPGASYIDALALLSELGIDFDVSLVELPNRRRFATIGDAVEHYRDALLVPDAPDTRRELEQLLSFWLLGRRGSLRSPLRATPAAIVHWRPDRSQ